jgi:hypothetical protein
VISEQNYDNTYTPHVEWANVKYQFTPDLSVRCGRTALPIFMVTDSREIGYANPRVRPPDELYRIVPVRSIDGADASYRVSLGPATNTLQVTVPSVSLVCARAAQFAFTCARQTARSIP